MSTIGLQPVSMRSAALTIGGDVLTLAVDRVEFVPSATVAWERGATSVGATPYIESVTWLLALSFAQDVTTPASLTRLLLEHYGEVRTVRLATPARAYQATALLVPTNLGGATNTIPTSSLALPLLDSPAPVA